MKICFDGDSFARTLPRVGFGTQTEESRKKHGEDFARMRTANGLAVRDLPFDRLTGINPCFGLLGAGRR